MAPQPDEPAWLDQHDEALSVGKLSEIVAALTRALDLTEGQIPGHTVRACLIGMRIGEAIGLDSVELSDLYYALLLKDLGCSSNAGRVARLFGSDDHGVKRELKTVDWSRLLPAARYGLANAAVGQSTARRVYHALRVGIAGQRGARALIKLRCEQGSAIARQMGFSEATAAAIRNLDEHWDGHGHPDGLAGTEIPLLSRIAGLAQTTEVFVTAHGVKAMIDMLADRNGRWFDPTLVDALREFSDDKQWWRTIRSVDSERLVIAAEPDIDVFAVDEVMLDRIAEAFADVIDAKSPYTARHSRRVASYARQLGEALHLDRHTTSRLYRAGLVHDIGKLGVSNRILDKPGRLTSEERLAVEQHPRFTWHILARVNAVEQHPRFTWHILARVNAFRGFAWDSALHHEKIDGTGYPWGIDERKLSTTARILAVADVFEALTADRPYRRGMSVERALTIIEGGRGRHFDGDVVRAIRAISHNDVPQ